MSCVPRKRAKWHVKTFHLPKTSSFTFNICYISSASIVPVYAIFYWLRLFCRGLGYRFLMLPSVILLPTVFVFLFLSLQLLSSWVEYSLLWFLLDAILTLLNVAKYNNENCMLGCCELLKPQLDNPVFQCAEGHNQKHKSDTWSQIKLFWEST